MGILRERERESQNRRDVMAENVVVRFMGLDLGLMTQGGVLSCGLGNKRWGS